MESISSGKSLDFSPTAVRQALVDYEADSGFVLDDEQRAAVCTAILEPVSIITGGPGTGKMQTLKAIREVLLYLYPDARIAGCAPTGKAAIRMKETSELAASTIHKLLHITPDDDWVEQGTLEYDYVIVDETTRESVELLGALSLDWTEKEGRYIHRGVKLFDVITYQNGCVCARFSEAMTLYLLNCPSMPLPLPLLAVSGKSPHSYPLGWRCLVHNTVNKGQERQTIRVGSLLAVCPRIPRAEPGEKWSPSVLERKVIAPFTMAMNTLATLNILTWKFQEPVCRNDYDGFSDSMVEFQVQAEGAVPVSPMPADCSDTKRE